MAIAGITCQYAGDPNEGRLSGCDSRLATKRVRYDVPGGYCRVYYCEEHLAHRLAQMPDLRVGVEDYDPATGIGTESRPLVAA